VKVGDLVKMPPSSVYWWGDKVGIIDLIESRHGGAVLEYRIVVSPGRYARFSETSFVELISEGR
jgi:hypothetical protein